MQMQAQQMQAQQMQAQIASQIALNQIQQIDGSLGTSGLGSFQPNYNYDLLVLVVLLDLLLDYIN